MTAKNLHYFNTCLIVGSNKNNRDQKAEEIIGFSTAKTQNNPDFFLLTSKNSIGIEEIRNLQRYLSLKPFSSEKKIAFIQEAQNLSLEAQNALLKTLEEPPPHSTIIMTAPNTSCLLPTVVSRSQIINLKTQNESSLSSKKNEDLTNFLSLLLKSSIPKRFFLIEEGQIAKDRPIAEEWVEEMISCVRSMMIKQTIDYQTCLKILKLLLRTKFYLEANCNTRLCLENLMICLPTPGVKMG